MATESTRVDVRERRSFSVDEKRRIVGEYRRAVAAGLGGGVVLRREGIYQSLVFKWANRLMMARSGRSGGVRPQQGKIRPGLVCVSLKPSWFGHAPRSTRLKS